METLKERWVDLASRNFTDVEKVGSIYQLLEKHYQESSRYYHNFSHIQALFTKAELLQINWLSPDLVNFAIWFHDVIYDATRTDNEQKSATFAIEVLRKQTSLNQPWIDYVNKLILSTAKHELLIDNQDFRLFLDLDLSILGETWNSYQIYAENIRKEYHHVPLEMYRAGRKQVLERFLERDTIYYSEHFRDLLEQQARANIRKEIEEVLSKSA